MSQASEYAASERELRLGHGRCRCSDGARKNKGQVGAMGETLMNGVEKIHAGLQCEVRDIRRGLESINSLLGWVKIEREFAVGDDTNRSFQQSEQQIL